MLSRVFVSIFCCSALIACQDSAPHSASVEVDAPKGSAVGKTETPSNLPSINIASRDMSLPWVRAVSASIQSDSSLRAAQIAITSKQVSAHNESRWLRPSVSLTGSQIYSSSAGDESQNIALSIRQPILDFGRRSAKTALALSEEQTAIAQLRTQQQTIVHEMANAYISNGEALAQISISNQKLHDLQALLGEVKQLFSIGYLNEEELSKVEAEVANTQTDIAEFESARTRANLIWSHYSNAPMPAYKSIFKEILSGQGMNNAASVANVANKKNSDILVANSAALESAKKMDLAQTSLLPVLSGVVNAVPNDSRNDIDLRYGLAVDVPVFNVDTNSNIQQSQFDYAGAEAAALEVQRNVYDQINSNWGAIADSNRLISAYQKSAAALLRRVQSLRNQIDSGFTTLEQLVDAQTNMYDNQSKLSYAQFSRDRSYANLLVLSGWP